MENLKEVFKNVKFYNSLVTEIEKEDFTNPEFLKNQMWNSYFAYLLANNLLAEKILTSITNYQFDGDYDKWTWIEGAIVLLSRIYKENNNDDKAKLEIDRIFQTLEYGSDEMKKKIRKKAFKRRLEGQLLNHEKIVNARENNNLELEFLFLMSYIKELIFIKEIGESEKFNDQQELEEMIEKNICRAKEISLM